MATLEKTSYAGWPNCLRLSNGRVELIVTLDVGPRVIRYGVAGGPNLFKEFDDQVGKTRGTEWLIFGGHRLWHAPEIFPRTYAPDFDPVEHDWSDEVLRLVQPTEPSTGIQKEIHVWLTEDDVRLTHRLINRNVWAIEIAPWCLSVMAPGGRAIAPQEEFHPHPDVLHPARPLVLWHFTRMNDPRFTWGDRLIQLREDASVQCKQKVGLRNARRWAAYHLGDQLFVKTFELFPGAAYPDYGSNCELYTQPGFLEIETLGPLSRLDPGQAVDHIEHWRLFRGVELPQEEPRLVAALEPFLSALSFPSSQRTGV